MVLLSSREAAAMARAAAAALCSGAGISTSWTSRALRNPHLAPIRVKAVTSNPASARLHAVSGAARLSANPMSAVRRRGVPPASIAIVWPPTSFAYARMLGLTSHSLSGR